MSNTCALKSWGSKFGIPDCLIDLIGKVEPITTPDDEDIILDRLRLKEGILANNSYDKGTVEKILELYIKLSYVYSSSERVVYTQALVERVQLSGGKILAHCFKPVKVSKLIGEIFIGRNVYYKNGGRFKIGKYVTEHGLIGKIPNVKAVEYRPHTSEIVRREGAHYYLNAYPNSIEVDSTGNYSKGKELFEEYLDRMVDCSRTKEALTDWAAWSMQNPDKPLLWAPLFMGQNGTGKSFYLQLVSQCAVGYTPNEVSTKILLGNDNSLLVDSKYILLDELDISKRDVYDDTKSILGGSTLTLRQHYMSPRSVHFLGRIAIATNEHYSAISNGDRRFLQVRTKTPSSVPEYRKFISRLVDNIHHIRAYLSTKSVIEFDPKGADTLGIKNSLDNDEEAITEFVKQVREECGISDDIFPIGVISAVAKGNLCLGIDPSILDGIRMPKIRAFAVSDGYSPVNSSMKLNGKSYRVMRK